MVSLKPHAVLHGLKMSLGFTKCNNSTLGMIEFVSPFDTIFDTMGVLRKEGCNK